MITQFVNSVIIIDNTPAEVKDLVSVLQDQDIMSLSFTPNDLKGKKIKKNRQLIFLDLSLDDTKDIISNIALIRKLLADSLDADFGIYGIILWSNHQSHIDTLIEKLQIDRSKNSYPTPLFVVGLDKMKYFTAGNFSTLFDDIENVLKNDAASTFFLEWSNSVQCAQNKTVSTIYSLMPDYKNQSNDMVAILTKLALNHTGIQTPIKDYPIHIDAFKAFDEILNGELINSHVSSSTNIVDNTKIYSNPNSLSQVYAYLNSAILIDSNNLNQGVVVPGNIYKIQNNNCMFKSDKAPVDAKNVVFEITPPCDFSNSGRRIRARLIGGFLIDVDATIAIKKQLENLKCAKECFYAQVYPIMISGYQNPQLLILDFRYFGMEEDNNLQDLLKYTILFRAKPKLFADVLQKFSAHAARLGLSVIHP